MEEVDRIVDNFVTKGKHSASWNGSNFPGGTYFTVLKADDFVSVKSVVLVK